MRIARRCSVYRRLPAGERLLLPLLALLLAAARIGVRRAGVGWTRRAAARLAPRSDVGPARLAFLVDAAARTLPGRTACLPRAIVLEALLAGAGWVPVLRIGIAPREGRARLDAHAWVELDGVAVAEEPSGYTPLPLFGARA